MDFEKVGNFISGLTPVGQGGIFALCSAVLVALITMVNKVTILVLTQKHERRMLELKFTSQQDAEQSVAINDEEA